MRKLLYCAAALLISPITALSAKLPEQSTLLVDVTNMPKQMQNGTFVQASFEDSVEAAVSDPTLDFRKLIPLLESDLKSSDVRVRRYAALVVSQLSTRRANSTEELGPLMSTVVQSIDDIDRGVQVASIVAAAGLHPIVPDSVVNPLLARLSRDDINHESYAILAGFLTKIRPNDPPTDAVVISFLKNPKLSNNFRVQAIQEIGAPNVSDLISREIVEMLVFADDEQVKAASIRASEKIGPRALNLERDYLSKIQSDSTRSPFLRQEASQALSSLGKQ